VQKYFNCIYSTKNKIFSNDNSLTKCAANNLNPFLSAKSSSNVTSKIIKRNVSFHDSGYTNYGTIQTGSSVPNADYVMSQTHQSGPSSSGTPSVNYGSGNSVPQALNQTVSWHAAPAISLQPIVAKENNKKVREFTVDPLYRPKKRRKTSALPSPANMMSVFEHEEGLTGMSKKDFEEYICIAKITRQFTNEENEFCEMISKKIRNRESARRSRENKTKTIKELRDQIDDLIFGSNMLKAENDFLKNENDTLKKKVSSLMGTNMYNRFIFKDETNSDKQFYYSNSKE